MGDFHPSSGVTPWSLKPNYGTYKSRFGPKYEVPTNINGWTAAQATKLGLKLGAFGAVAGIFVIFYVSDVPRVRRDILERIPVLGSYWHKEIPPSDNPF